MMPLLRLTLTLVLLSTPALAQKTDPPEDAPAIIEAEGIELFEDTHIVMNEAVAEAQATLPLFLDFVLDEFGIAQGGSLKVAFQTFPQDIGHEIIWVAGFRQLEDGSFEGFLNNQPFNLGDWSQGDRVTFEAADVRDWSLATPEGLYGNYTTRVIAAQPGNDYLWQSLTPDPLPANWQ